ncbi:hypothetical protein Clacol_007849 [Clathrus columnatus]|uniref:Terpenoid synthase n=1 Tax=Clathrus columnatus TaxID=1419009 RepID=A0AAV5AJ95_9AGAM|nr:hypothetical protein Clacol_007849 [Clathrus columnatus]
MPTTLLSRYHLLTDQRRPISLIGSTSALGNGKYTPVGLIRDILSSFIRRASRHGALNFDPPPTNHLEPEVLKEVNELNIDLSSVQRWFTWACQVAEGFYPSHPTDLKVLIAISNLAIFYIDDNLSKKPELLYAFQLNLLNGIPQSDPILECLSKVLIPRMWKYFHPLAANAIAVGFYEFIQGTAMESITKKMTHIPSAPEFPEYVRLKSGAPAPYAYWLFYHPDCPDVSPYLQGIPDFLGVLNRINDILSFYKEELAGEDDNFVHMRAKVSGRKGIVVTLREICEETLILIDCISDTLSGTPEHLAVFQGFIIRYIRFHTSTTRYQLKELMMEN